MGDYAIWFWPKITAAANWTSTSCKFPHESGRSNQNSAHAIETKVNTLKSRDNTNVVTAFWAWLIRNNHGLSLSRTDEESLWDWLIRDNHGLSRSWTDEESLRVRDFLSRSISYAKKERKKASYLEVLMMRSNGSARPENAVKIEPKKWWADQYTKTWVRTRQVQIIGYKGSARDFETSKENGAFQSEFTCIQTNPYINRCKSCGPKVSQ